MLQSPGLLKTSKDYHRSQMGMDRVEATVIHVNRYGPIPGKPIVPFLQSVPVSSNISESYGREREDQGENRKRKKMDGLHQGVRM